MNKNPIIRKHGIIIGVVSILINILVAIYPDWVKLGYLSMIVFFAGIIMSCIEYGKSMHNKVTFGQVFRAGFFTALIATAILLISVPIIWLAIPDYKDIAINTYAQAMQSASGVAQAQKDQAIEMYSQYFWQIGILSIIMQGIILGILAALIGAAVTKKEPQKVF